MSHNNWNDVRNKMPNFVVDGNIVTDMPVEVRRADGTEEKTIYQGFGHWGYAPDYITDVTHWKPSDG
jgi:hypothetical protein